LGGWGLGVGVWGFGPQPPIPNPQSPKYNIIIKYISIYKYLKYLKLNLLIISYNKINISNIL
jgi:hypothetical protein